MFENDYTFRLRNLLHLNDCQFLRKDCAFWKWPLGLDPRLRRIWRLVLTLSFEIAISFLQLAQYASSWAFCSFPGGGVP
jgi:hypothetical protein